MTSRAQAALVLVGGLGIALPAARAAPPRAPKLDALMTVVDQRVAARGRRPLGPLAHVRATLGRSPRRAPDFVIARGAAAKGLERLPLEASRAEVDISGVIAAVRLVQRYRNRGKRPIEAIYRFPASRRAAIHGLRLRVGSRTITARIAPRRQARRSYLIALGRQRRAALLAQDRANVFRMRVANIQPGDAITVEVDYSEILVPTEGRYELVIPTVVGPRAQAKRGSGPAATTAPAVRVDPSSPGAPRFDAKVRLRVAMPLQKIGSPSHDLATNLATDRRSATARLKKPSATDRDFVLRYRLRGGAIATGALTYEEGGQGYFLVQAEPPRAVGGKPLALPPREYLFVIDVSGSMAGYPLEATRALVAELLAQLTPRDYFNVILFAGAAHALGARAVPATPANRQRAQEILGAQHGGGGTELMDGLRTAYAMPRPSFAPVARSVVVITDGYVDVEAQTFRFVRRRLSQANCFAFGIGRSVNRALIHSLARAGMGEAFVVLRPEDASGVAARFRRYVGAPLWSRLRWEVKGARVSDALPRQPPDLLARRPVIIVGKYRPPARGAAISLRGIAARGEVVKTIVLPPPNSANRPLKRLWARRWVGELMDQLAVLPRYPPLVRAVTWLGLQHALVTRFTSLVAVDAQRAGRQPAARVVQPLPLPAGVGAGLRWRFRGKYWRDELGPYRRHPAVRPIPPSTPPSVPRKAKTKPIERTTVHAPRPASLQRRPPCGCRTGGSHPPLAILIFLPAVAWLLRRRRGGA